MNRRRMLSAICRALLCAAVFLPRSPAAEKGAEVPLTGNGEKLMARYGEMLSSLRKEVAESLPAIDEKKMAAFLDARSVLSSLQAPAEGSSADVLMTYRNAHGRAESNTLHSARAVLADLDGFLASDELDERLMKVAILTHGTPRGLAEFAQQGAAEEGLIRKLLDDPVLMKQVLVAGGANGGEYGEAMQVYAALRAASERAREEGSILQRLALGMALQQPWLKGKEKGGVYGTVYADSDTPDGQVSRYLHYEKAYADGELDPAIEDMNAWECRFITNDPYTNEELAWTREMLRNYRPDHITNPDYKWRYAGMVKSDVPYRTPDWRPDEGTTKVQQIVAGGGKCGPRAFFGRTVCRAFGIPSRRSTQTGHAAMNHWTPDGWVVCFGAWWSWNWAGPWGGEDFLLESQAREYPEEFMKVLRAQWVGDALDEEDVSIRYYGKGGGAWNALAFYKKRAVVEDAKAAALQAELAALTGEEAKVQLGETDEAPAEQELDPMIELRPEDRTIVVGDDGVLTVPVAACVKPTSNTERVLFMTNLVGDVQVHYTRLGRQPELLRYDIEVPKEGKYELVLRVCTVARDQTCLLRLNRRTLIDVDLPSTWGHWQDTKPIEIDMREGRNTLMFTCAAPNRGVSMKYLKLSPVK